MATRRRPDGLTRWKYIVNVTPFGLCRSIGGRDSRCFSLAKLAMWRMEFQVLLRMEGLKFKYFVFCTGTMHLCRLSTKVRILSIRPSILFPMRVQWFVKFTCLKSLSQETLESIHASTAAMKQFKFLACRPPEWWARTARPQQIFPNNFLHYLSPNP